MSKSSGAILMKGPLVAVLAAALLSGGAAVFPAAAESYETSAYSLFEETNTTRDNLADGQVMITITSAGTFVTDNPDIPLNQSLYKCFGTFVVSADGTESKGNGFCSGIDLREDVWWVRWTGSIGGGTWTFIDGTGRYQGMTGSGQWQQADAGFGRDVNTWTGTIELP
jgi:hypothetical protein